MLISSSGVLIAYLVQDDLRPHWLTAIGTIALAFLTLVLAVLAIFGEKIQSRLKRPKLNLKLECCPPHCHKTILKAKDKTGASVEPPCYYFRLQVINEGNERAELVEVWADELKTEDGKKVARFLPMNLRWAHYHNVFQEAISPGMQKHCDLGHIVDPNVRPNLPEEHEPTLPANEITFSFDVTATTTKSHLIGPGKYLLTLKLAAANAKPLEKVLRLHIVGPWYDDETTMFNSGVHLEILP